MIWKTPVTTGSTKRFIWGSDQEMSRVWQRHSQAHRWSSNLCMRKKTSDFAHRLSENSKWSSYFLVVEDDRGGWQTAGSQTTDRGAELVGISCVSELEIHKQKGGCVNQKKTKKKLQGKINSSAQKGRNLVEGHNRLVWLGEQWARTQ